MIHQEVYKWFELYFPQYAKHVVEWFPNGKNSVRVRQSNRQDFIFTYNGKNDWCFETVESHIRKMRGGAGVAC